MRKRLLPIVLAMVSVLSLTACSETPVMPEPQTSRAAPVQPEIGENYYGNINFDFLSNGQIPYGETGLSSMGSIQNKGIDYLLDMVDRIVKSEPASGSLEEMVKELYLQYMDKESRENAGADELLQIVGLIEQCGTIDELVGAMGILYLNYGVRSLISPKASPDPYNTSENIVFFMNYNSMGNMKENFTRRDAGPEAIGKMIFDSLRALKVEQEEATERARNSVKLLNEIMLVSRDYEDIYDFDSEFKVYDKKKLKKLFSNIDIDNVIRSFGMSGEKYIVYDENQAAKVNELLTNENIRAIKDYIYGCILYDYSQALPPSFLSSTAEDDDSDENADENAKRFAAGVLEQEVGVIFGREVCTEKTMNMTKKMVNMIQTSCRDLINNCDRLSQDSKDKFLKKLENMTVLLGYDENMNPPFKIQPIKNGGNLLKNVIAIKGARIQDEMKSVGRPSDRSKWQMSAIEANATYYPTSNKIEIPALMMSNLSVDPDDNEYYNLGILGYVIGHEINHAFDSNGFKFDDLGNYKPKWINEADQNKYRELMEKAKDYYNNVKLLGVYQIDGELTLSENIADLAAVQCILHSTTDKENRRNIFEGVGKQWASLTRVTDLLIKLKSDVHSPAEARVNAVVASMDEFYEVYDVKEGDKMYVAPENRVKVW